jgi:adenylate cyclase
MAEPGGVCISGVVFEQIEGKIDLSFRSLGIQSLKNIAATRCDFFIGKVSATD